MNIFVHVCCARCFTYVHEKLLQNGFETVGFFYNPNIQPFTEYRNRLESVRKYELSKNVKIFYRDEYRLEEFLRGALSAKLRCEFCYTHRLEATACACKEFGYDTFTTTLLVSPYQKHELIKSIGEEIAHQHKLNFYYYDFREGFRETYKLSESLELYKQKYCGCIFSERERFEKKLV